jgi:hypothetical protein
VQLLLAGVQRGLQFTLQCLEVAELSADLNQFFLQAETNRGARLLAVATQRQKIANFLEREPQSLRLANESESLHVGIDILPVREGRGSKAVRS